jgi:uncharacterized membrane protein
MLPKVAWDDRHLHHAQLWVEMGSGVRFMSFLSRPSWTTFLLISASQVARIVVMSHCTQLAKYIHLWKLRNLSTTKRRPKPLNGVGGEAIAISNRSVKCSV